MEITNDFAEAVAQATQQMSSGFVRRGLSFDTVGYLGEAFVADDASNRRSDFKFLGIGDCFSTHDPLYPIEREMAAAKLVQAHPELTLLGAKQRLTHGLNTIRALGSGALTDIFEETHKISIYEAQRQDSGFSVL